MYTCLMDVNMKETIINTLSAPQLASRLQPEYLEVLSVAKHLTDAIYIS